MSERLFCAYCGKWGNHQSGTCLDMLFHKVKILEDKIHDLEQENLMLRAERDAAREEREILAQDCKELQDKLERYNKIMNWMVDSGYTVHKSWDGKSYHCYFYSEQPIYGPTPLEAIENAIRLNL